MQIVENVFVDEELILKLKTFNMKKHPSKIGVERVGIINMTTGIVYESILKEDNYEFLYECKIKIDQKGRNVLLPLINDSFITHLKTEINVKTKFDLSKLRIIGLQEQYVYKTSAHVILKSYDYEGNSLNYGGEKFKITIQKENSDDLSEELFYSDLKNGVYQIYGQLSILGKVVLSITHCEEGAELEVPGSPFRFETKENIDLQTYKNLGVSDEYVPDWKVWEGVRELMQNWRDGLIEGLGVTINDANFIKSENNNEIKYNVKYANAERGFLHYDKVNQILILKNKGVISRSCLALGKSNKRNDPNAAGHFGEGMKLAALSLLREQKGVTIVTGSEKWIFSIRYDEVYSINMLFVHIENLNANLNETEVTISGITQDEFNSILSKLRFLVKRPMMTNSGEILLKEEERGDIYVKGIFVTKLANYESGYDLNTLRIDRDRKLIADENELKAVIASVTCENIIKFGGREVYNILKNTNKSYLQYSEFALVGKDPKCNEASNILNLLYSNEYSNASVPYISSLENSSYARCLSNFGLKIDIIKRPLYEFLRLGSDFKCYHKLFQKYCIDNAGAWHQPLNNTEKNYVRDVISKLEALGLNVYDKHDVEKYRKGNPPFCLLSNPHKVRNKKCEIVFSPKCFENIKFIAPLFMNSFDNSFSFLD